MYHFLVQLFFSCSFIVYSWITLLFHSIPRTGRIFFLYIIRSPQKSFFFFLCESSFSWVVNEKISYSLMALLISFVPIWALLYLDSLTWELAQECFVLFPLVSYCLWIWSYFPMEGWLGMMHPQNSNLVTKAYFTQNLFAGFLCGKPVRLSQRIRMAVTLCREDCWTVSTWRVHQFFCLLNCHITNILPVHSSFSDGHLRQYCLIS